ncbi:MAG: DUF4232 domain-containing protein [Nocardioidaceae bacterium]
MVNRFRLVVAVEGVLAILVASGCAASSPAVDTTPAAAVPSVSTAAATKGSPVGKASPDGCRAEALRVRGGRQGENTGAHADIVVTNTSPAACFLTGLPRVSILRADGTALPIRQQTPAPHLNLRAVALAARGGTAVLTLYWSNWCHDRPGPLTIAVTLPGSAGTVRGPFNGPPDYDYVPGCLAKGKASTLEVTQAYGHSAPVGSVGECRVAQLRLTRASMTAGTFHYADLWTLENAGDQPCSLHGHPRVAFTTHGHHVAASVHASRVGPWGVKTAPVTTVIIEPGHSVGFFVGVNADPNTPPCPVRGQSILVTPPGASRALTSSQSTFAVCNDETLFVSPILETAIPPSEMH